MEPEEIARRWAKLSLSDDDGPIATVDEGLKAEGIRRLSLSLVGKIVSNREVNREAFRNTIASIWRTKSEVEVESIGVNLFVFRFGCFWDRKRVLEGGPWSFDKNLLALKEAVGIGRVSEIDFSLVPFWVQIYDLPLACMNRDMGLILIDVQQPLKRGLRFAFGAGGEVCSALLFSDADGQRWRFTGFYGEPKQWLREQSWVLLRRLAGLDNLPWLIGGDFNEILRGDEKDRGLVRMGSAMDGFREAVDSCNLLDMGFSGNKFTWCNRQFGGNVIWE
ncbi:hypothetical protein ACOSQ2_003739 [Xanthoceras sorbifolium]